MSVRTALRILPLVAATAVVLGTALPAAAAPGFGTATVDVAPPAPGTQITISGVTVGRHAGFDRVVFAVSGPTAGYRVGYVPRLVQDGSGATVPIRGAAILAVTIRSTEWTVHPSPAVNRSPGYEGLVQVLSAGEFEGYAQYGIGQASRAGFRVQRLTGPDRIVIDVAHPAAVATPGATPTGAAATGAAATTAAPAGGVAATSPAAAAGELPDTGAGPDPLPIAILGGVLVLAGIAAVGYGLRLTRHPA